MGVGGMGGAARGHGAGRGWAFRRQPRVRPTTLEVGAEGTYNTEGEKYTPNSDHCSRVMPGGRYMERIEGIGKVVT